MLIATNEPNVPGAFGNKPTPPTVASKNLHFNGNDISEKVIFSTKTLCINTLLQSKGCMLLPLITKKKRFVV